MARVLLATQRDGVARGLMPIVVSVFAAVNVAATGMKQSRHSVPQRFRAELSLPHPSRPYLAVMLTV